MVRVSPFLLIAGVVSTLTCAQSPPQQARYEISGIVVDHRTKSPVGSVMVSITPVVVNARSESWSVVTAVDGSFHFAGLVKGKYALSAERRGQQEQPFHGHGQFSTAIVTGPDLDSQHIVFPLFQDARITGTVLDEEGDPVQSAQVFLLRKHVFDGKSRIDMQSQQNTSSSGNYRFGHLRPGTYYLAVSARPWYANSNQIAARANAGELIQDAEPSPAALDRAYPITYSGDTTDPVAAQPVEVLEGVSASAPINLHAVAAVHVTLPETGRTTGPSSGYQVVTLGPGRVPISVGFQADGDHQMSGLAPGSYRLIQQVADTTSQNVIQIDASGVAAASSTTYPHVAGHITFKGSVPSGNVALQLVGDGQGAAALIQPDGSFAVGQPVPPGRYRLAIAGEADMSVQTVAVGKQATAGNALVIPADSPGSLELSIVAGPSSASTWNGIAVREDKPVSGAMVLLLPEALGDNATIGRDQSDSDGTFSIPEVQPGRYTVLAFDCEADDDSCGLEYRNPAFLKTYLATAKHVTIPAASKDAVEVPVIAPTPQ